MPDDETPQDGPNVQNLQDQLSDLIARMQQAVQAAAGGGPATLTVTTNDIRTLQDINSRLGDLRLASAPDALCLSQGQVQAIMRAMANVMLRLSSGEKLGPPKGGGGD